MPDRPRPRPPAPRAPDPRLGSAANHEPLATLSHDDFSIQSLGNFSCSPKKSSTVELQGSQPPIPKPGNSALFGTCKKSKHKNVCNQTASEAYIELHMHTIALSRSQRVPHPLQLYCLRAPLPHPERQVVQTRQHVAHWPCLCFTEDLARGERTGCGPHHGHGISYGLRPAYPTPER